DAPGIARDRPGRGDGAGRARVGAAPRDRRAQRGAPDRRRPSRPRGPLLRGDRGRARARARHGALAPASGAHGFAREARAVLAMTCYDARDQFSALADDALASGERAALDAHLATCADCRRELQRFRDTVALLHAVAPARAPAGFVDRVLEAARPRPWYALLFRGLFLPCPVNLPMRAPANLLLRR